MTPNWYVITGGPSTGKTTLLYRLSLRGYKTIPEAARAVIDEGIEKGLTVDDVRKDEHDFQIAVLNRKLEVESKLDKDQLTFFDRGMHDTTAYCGYYGYPLTEKEKKSISDAKYKAVFVLNNLKRYESDYARTEGQDFRNKIEEMFVDAYSADDIPVIRVPDIGLNERVEFILDYVRQDNK